jgi:hypothetical protein
MKRLILQIYIQLFVSLCISCKAENQISQQNPNSMSGTKLIIKIVQKAFAATLLNKPTITAFKTLLPLTIKINELNNNEKFADLSKNLPINASVPPSIHTDDLMMYCSRTLVLFYKGFSTLYSILKSEKLMM